MSEVALIEASGMSGPVERLSNSGDDALARVEVVRENAAVGAAVEWGSRPVQRVAGPFGAIAEVLLLVTSIPAR